MKEKKAAGYIFYSCSILIYISYTMCSRVTIKFLQHTIFSCCGKEDPHTADCRYTFRSSLQLNQCRELNKRFDLLLAIIIVQK